MSEAENLFESILDNKETKMSQAKVDKKPTSKPEKSETVSVSVDFLKSMSDKIDALEKKLAEKEEKEYGNPANEWAKKLAQEKANRQPKPYKTIYTIKDNKVLKVDIKENGAYSAYIGNNKKHKAQLEPLIKQWKKEGVWVDEWDLEEKTKEIMSEIKG